MRSLIGLCAAIHAASIFGMDLESGIRNLRRYQQWFAMDFRSPYSGLFLSARASTEDRRKDATLNITASPDNERGRCSEKIEVLFKLQKPAETDSDRDGLVEIQLGNTEPRLLSSKVSTLRGNEFLFVHVLGDLRPSELRGHRSLLVNARGVGFAEFSLQGFPDAWKTASATCAGFQPPKG
jgi:hypothetical protein